MMVYLIKANIALALCAIAYAGISRRDTHFAWRRAALLVLLAAGFALPLLEPPAAWSWSGDAADGAAGGRPLAVWQLPGVLIEAAGPGMAEDGAALLRTAGVAYAVVVAVLLLRLATRTAALLLTLRRCLPATVDGMRVRLLPRDATPFSFFRLIALPAALATDSRRDEVLAHEAAHARQWHSLDVLASGHDPRSYQYHLLEQTLPQKAAALQNNFYVLLKKRIQMMNKPQSQPAGRAKYLLFLPFLALLALGCMNVTAVRAGQPAPARSETAVRTADAGNDKVYDKADVMPAFPGGQQALARFIGENLTYPATAQENNVQGRVIVQFTVGTDGSVKGVRVVNSVDPALDNEVVRTLQGMPKWTPAQRDGQAVEAEMTYGVVFKFEGDPNAPKGEEGDIVVVGFRQ